MRLTTNQSYFCSRLFIVNERFVLENALEDLGVVVGMRGDELRDAGHFALREHLLAELAEVRLALADAQIAGAQQRAHQRTCAHATDDVKHVDNPLAGEVLQLS